MYIAATYQDASELAARASKSSLNPRAPTTHGWLDDKEKVPHITSGAG